MANAFPNFTLRVKEATDSAARPVGLCRLAGAAQDALAHTALARALEIGVAGSTERHVTVRAFHRGALPSSFRCGIAITCADHATIAEWNRFCRYLAYGMEGRSAPKVAILSCSAALLPPAPPPPPAAAGEPALPLFFCVADGLPCAHAVPGAAPLCSSCAGWRASVSVAAPAAPPAPPPVFVSPWSVSSADVAAVAAVPRGADAYVSHGTVYASPAAVRAAITDGSIGKVKEDLVSRIVAGDVPFPYKRACISEAQAREWFALLRRYAGTVSLSVSGEPFPLHGYLPGGGVFECTVAAPLAARWEGPADAGSSSGSASASSTASSGSAAPPQLRITLPPPRRVAVPEAAVTDLCGAGRAVLPFEHAFNEVGAALVDYFSEPARMGAVWKSEGAPPRDLWRRREVAQWAVDKAVRKYGELTDFSLRHGLYGRVAGCNLFKCHLASALYTVLGGTRILDPCAGWGDRLLGAMGTVAVTRYLAFDPNPALVPAHGGMIDAFAAAAGGSYAVIPLPFEEGVIPPPAVLTAVRPAAAAAGLAGPAGTLGGAAAAGAGAVDVVAGAAAGSSDADLTEAAAAAPDPETSALSPPDFDLIFTSPPYFDLEIYEDERRRGLAPPSSAGAAAAAADGVSKQSTVKFPSLHAWLEGWFFPMMAKAWAHLRPGGHMAFYINDHAGKDDAEDGHTRAGGAGPAAKRARRGDEGADAAGAAASEDRDKDVDIHMCLPMLRFAGSRLPQCVWVGTLGVAGETGNLRPLWIWRKGEAIRPNAAGSVAPLYAMLAERVAGPKPR